MLRIRPLMVGFKAATAVLAFSSTLVGGGALSEVAALKGAWQAPVAGQPASTYISSAAINDIVAALKRGPKGPFPGEALRVVDAGGYNVGVAVVHRIRRENQSLLHDKVTEIYQVIDGIGTLMTGGVLVNPKPADAELYKLAGPGAAGTAIQGGKSQRIGAGDVVIIPALTPHMFTEIEGSITYLIMRVDPEKVLRTQ